MEKADTDFRDLDVWRHCKEIRLKFWTLVKSFPEVEKYRLTDQIVRSSRSAPACIAEGYGRFHYQENIQFCRQARGSLFELLDHVGVALECDYINETEELFLISEIKEAIRLLNGYIRYLVKQKESASNSKNS